MAIGFIVQGVADGIRYFLVRDNQSDLIMIACEVIIGVGVAIFGAVLSSSMRGSSRLDKERTAS